jgi:hypothetical protein
VLFQHIALIASLAGGLAQYHDSLGVGLVDLVLEDVRSVVMRYGTRCCCICCMLQLLLLWGSQSVHSIAVC